MPSLYPVAQVQAPAKAAEGAKRLSGRAAVPQPREQDQPAAAAVSRKARDRSMRQQRARLRKRGSAKVPGDAADGQALPGTGMDFAAAVLAAAQPSLKRPRRADGEQASTAQKGARRPAQAGAAERKGGKQSGAPLRQVFGDYKKI